MNFTEEIVRYALKRYGNNKDWMIKIFDRFSFDGIARMYKEEYINFLDEKEAKDMNELIAREKKQLKGV